MNRIREVIARLRWGILLGVLIFGAGHFLRQEMSHLPQLPQVKFWEPAEPSVLLDRNGKEIFSFAIEKRDYVPLKEIPPILRQAFIATEDERFYEHWGMDLRSMARAVWANFVRGRVVQGGSTITQQLAKNLFLSREKSLRRKLRELLLSIYIETNLSKDEILEMYLNQVYLGHGVYGVSEGVRTFFGHDLSQTEPAEAALIAGLIKAPSKYSPWKLPEAARKRSRVVLRRMESLGFVSSTTVAQAISNDVVISSRSATILPPAFAHMIEHVRQEMEERYSADMLWKGGLRIETTIDAAAQEHAYAVMTAALDRFDQERHDWEAKHGNVAFATTTLRIEGAYVALEVKTGSILVWLGGRDFRSSQFNHVIQSKRQPGSAFKPFVWLAALNMGATPATIYDDLPLAYTYDGRSWRLVEGSTDFYRILEATSSLASEMFWVPNNFDGKYLGPISLRRALALSRNLVSIRIVEQVGPAQVVALAKKAGIKSRLQPVPSLGLGTGVVTLLELAGAYQTLANMGVHAEPQVIRRVTQGATETILEHNRPLLTEALAPTDAFLLVDIMKSVATEGTAKYAGLRIKRPLAGKTGTTQDNRDLWFMGFTPDVVSGGWMGYDNFEPLGKKDATGGSTVVPWWTEATQTLMESYPNREFGPPPEGINYQKVCVMSGLLARSRCPKTRLEVFLRDSAPSEYCDLESHETVTIVRPENWPEATTLPQEPAMPPSPNEEGVFIETTTGYADEPEPNVAIDEEEQEEFEEEETNGREDSKN
ncbi:MAG: PBP1A family penicillin-binding protein [Elusimicrobia bacterium]|nr:PBP1A family penicillin-binding protein [Elusimicrobiota bacterium]